MDKLDIVNSLEALRKEYIRRGYDAQGLVKIIKTGPSRYEVRHEGVLLGWATQIGNTWRTYIVTGIGTGRLVDAAKTRRDAVNEIVWQTGRFKDACAVADRHLGMKALGC